MKRSITLIVLLAVLPFASSAQGQSAKARNRAKAGKTSSKATPKAASLKPTYVPVHKYDPARNAEQDLQAAMAEAKRTDKRILVEVGGLWCKWCHFMDQFFEKNPDLLAYRERNFVMIKINFSPENKNEAVLSRYPKIEGYPHIFVLDADGTLLHSQDTGLLEEGKNSYNPDKFSSFLESWAPSERATTN